MAGEERSRQEFASILAGINRKFDIIHAKWLDEKNFEAKFRSQIPRDNEDYNGMCDQWVDLFSDITRTTWVKKISNTGPKIKFRKQYQCWTHTGKVQKELLFDARKCRATTDVKVLTDNPHTRRKNKYIKAGLNIVVKINFTHLHNADINKPYSFFVHMCEPQAEPLKPIVHSNEKLPKMIADIVEKGKKAVPVQKDTEHQQNEVQPPQQMANNNQMIQVQNLDQLNMIQLNQMVPLPGLEAIKLEVQPQIAQVMVSSSQIDMIEPLLVCQPTLMFNQTQVIPVSSSSYVHVPNPQNIPQNY